MTVSKIEIFTCTTGMLRLNFYQGNINNSLQIFICSSSFTSIYFNNIIKCCSFHILPIGILYANFETNFIYIVLISALLVTGDIFLAF